MIKAEYVDHMGSDLSVVNAARVSFNKRSRWEVDYDQVPCGVEYLSESDCRLIKYLANHKHISPFGHAFASFHAKAPIFVAKQLVKHKFLRWNEVSRRYIEDVPEFYPMNFRASVEDKKQGSGDLVGDAQQQATWHDFDRVEKAAQKAYLNAISEGVAPEQARGILPQTLMTEWYWSGSLDAFADMCRLRLKSDAQVEASLVAKDVDKLMGGLFPVSWKALMDAE